MSAVNARKFRFGLAAGSPASASAWREQARKAEDLGFSVLLVADHMGRSAAPLPAALAAADATSRLRVGTQVLANDFRNPAILAKEVATIDLLTDGRFELGIGVGWPATSPTGRSDYAQTGIALEEAGPRVKRLQESVRIIKAFLTDDEPVSLNGEHYQIEGLVPLPRPVQTPRPPIMIAGAGPRMLRLAAREADIINMAPRPPIVGPSRGGSIGFGLTKADELAIVREAAGERYAEIELCVFAMYGSVTNDVEPALEKLAADLQTTPDVVREMPATLIGSTEAIVERLQAHREQYDISYRIVPAGVIDDFAPIVARLAGT